MDTFNTCDQLKRKYQLCFLVAFNTVLLFTNSGTRNGLLLCSVFLQFAGVRLLLLCRIKMKVGATGSNISSLSSQINWEEFVVSKLPQQN